MLITKYRYQSCVSNNQNVRTGLVGLSHNSKYITLPVEANYEIDQSLEGDQPLNRGERSKNDGWTAPSNIFAGAVPRLAGICALVKQAYLRLLFIQVRDVLTKTAPSITRDKRIASAEVHSAHSGTDLAKGASLPMLLPHQYMNRKNLLHK